jgi:pimeloyl-ACP methyl ester carboxylesterase/predicted glycosyltransferase
MPEGMDDRERARASAMTAQAASPAQTRALYPEREGLVERDGVRIHWEGYGRGDPAILLVPPWSVVHARCWKMQVPDFARRHQVLTFDPRGNGGSDRPDDPAAYAPDEFAADGLAVMDAAGVERAVVVGLSLGAQRALILANNHPARVLALVLAGPAVNLGVTRNPERLDANRVFDIDTGADEGWARYNAHSWRRDYQGFLEFFFHQAFPEPHSTKQIEDCVGWGLDTDAETLITAEGPGLTAARTEELCARVRCPVLVVHGEHDAIVPHAVGVEATRRTGGRLVTFEGSGHCPQARDPVRFNLVLRDFIATSPPPQERWTRARSRRRRALYVSSPIGLGHARRDVAIADELRKLHPDLEIDWLAQHPVTAVLEERGERIHPASASLASESGHMQAESHEHDLHCFQALRRMDEILLSNFMVFHDVAETGQYDVWIGDEAWEVDYYLHENPELKSAAYVWLTDFVGFLPMEDGGAHERSLTADYNAEMIEHVARLPRVRDRSIFIGEPEDIVPDSFGEGLPSIRDWTEQHFSFTGYITSVAPADHADRIALREQLGYPSDQQVCLVTVGGSGVGAPLLRRVIDSFPEAKRLVPQLRMVVVAGPRIDPSTLPATDGLEIRPYVHDLPLHLAACDLAIIQGGLATAMELTASRRPFIYIPLKHHFEQNFHVRHRLERYRAGRRMDYDDSPPHAITAAIAQEIGREVDYPPVVTDGAARAAALIAEVL